MHYAQTSYEFKDENITKSLTVKDRLDPENVT